MSEMSWKCNPWCCPSRYVSMIFLSTVDCLISSDIATGFESRIRRFRISDTFPGRSVKRKNRRCYRIPPTIWSFSSIMPGMKIVNLLWREPVFPDYPFDHSPPATTMKIYVHALKCSDKEAAEKLGSPLSYIKSKYHSSPHFLIFYWHGRKYKIRCSLIPADF